MKILMWNSWNIQSISWGNSEYLKEYSIWKKFTESGNGAENYLANDSFVEDLPPTIETIKSRDDKEKWYEAELGPGLWWNHLLR